MRILHVINRLGMGGAQILIMEMCPYLIKNGHTVKVIELIRGDADEQREQLDKLGIEHEVLSERISVYNPLFICKLAGRLKGYDIVHVHLFPSFYWTYFASVICSQKVNLVYTEHSTTNRRRGNPLLKVFDSFIYKRYKRIVACSDKAKESLEAHLSNIRCISIPNGIGTLKYSSAIRGKKGELFKCSEDSFVAIMVARFRYPKRHDVLVESLNYLPVNFHVAFVGGDVNDDGLNNIKQLAEQYKVLSRVHFLYRRTDIPELLKTADVIVLSSEYEGLSLSSIEGLASGRPVVASDVNGLRDIIGNSGILFKCGDSKGLADALFKLQNDKTYYNMVANKCEEESKKYDILNVVNSYQDVYNKVINKNI